MIVALLKVFRFAALNPTWLIIAVVLHGLYASVNLIGIPFWDIEAVFGDLNWNWDGKIASFVVSLLVLLLLSIISKKVSFQKAGVTLTQNPGAVVPALIATGLLVASVIAAEIAVNDGCSLGVERILFQATMPGIDEEIYFRGLLLLVLAIAVESRGVNFLGAPINWAGVLVTLLFGLGHSLFWQEGAFGFSIVAFVFTFYLGFGLLWIREKTGSIFIPLVAHNLINVSGSFF
ncbi:MAG: CPBP family intramembrane glutamic endopeptidase [Pseudomonadota bacterium]